MGNTEIEEVPYAGWRHCHRITNKDVELIVTADVGPRIIRCGFQGGQNLLGEMSQHAGKSGEAWWMMRGGHRLWIAPELVPDTYALDNGPVKVTVADGCITLVQAVEPETHLQKEIAVSIEDSGEIVVMHRIENRGRKAKLFAPWALTVMATGGVALATFPPRTSHSHLLQPTNPLVMWAYTDFTDPRWTITKHYLVLRHDPALTSPQKAGLFNQRSFAAYLLGTDLFTKCATASLFEPYPDYHCSVELFANEEFLELETLGPLVNLQPDQSVTHVEHWRLHRDIHIDAFNDVEITRALTPVFAND